MYPINFPIGDGRDFWVEARSLTDFPLDEALSAYTQSSGAVLEPIRTHMPHVVAYVFKHPGRILLSCHRGRISGAIVSAYALGEHEIATEMINEFLAATGIRDGIVDDYFRQVIEQWDRDHASAYARLLRRRGDSR